MPDESREVALLQAFARLEATIVAIDSSLKDIQQRMVTKDMLQAYQDQTTFRFQTVEQRAREDAERMAEWRAKSESEHVKLDAQSVARHEKTLTKIHDLETEVESRDKEMKAQKNSRVQSYIISGVAVCTSIFSVILTWMLGSIGSAG